LFASVPSSRFLSLQPLSFQPLSFPPTASLPFPINSNLALSFLQ
jgi:hypothetical protein